MNLTFIGISIFSMYMFVFLYVVNISPTDRGQYRIVACATEKKALEPCFTAYQQFGNCCWFVSSTRLWLMRKVKRAHWTNTILTSLYTRIVTHLEYIPTGVVKLHVNQRQRHAFCNSSPLLKLMAVWGP